MDIHIALYLIISMVGVVVAAAITTGAGLRKVFRMGPVSLSPLMFLWSGVSYLSSSGESHDLWRLVPLHVGLAAAVLWHVALIAVEKERKFYLGYALFHLPVFILLVHGWAVIFATRFPL